MITHPIRKLAAALAALAMLAMGAPAAHADTSPFKDVTPGSAHYDDIVWLAQKGIAKGYGDGTFGGMRDVVRQDMAAFLYRAAGSPAFDQAKAARANKFRDVKPGSSHYKEVLWLTTTGITQGYPDHTFGGMRIVVRQDMAAFLHRYATNVLHATTTGGNAKAFKDVNGNTPHHDDIAWLSRAGITQGYPDHTFGGMRNVVRQDMAAFIHRTNNLKNTNNKPNTNKPDNNTNKPDNNTNKPDNNTPLPANIKIKKVITGGDEFHGDGYTTYAIDTNDDLWAWGANAYGEIGDGSTTTRDNPYRVKSLPKIAKIVTDSYTTYAIGKDGSLWAWGWNHHGKIGDGTVNNHLTPYKVKGLPAVTDIVTAQDCTTIPVPDGWPGETDFICQTIQTVYATGSDGSLWAWGNNGFGQVGDGTTNNRTTPHKLPITSKVANVTLSDDYSKASVYATGTDGTLWAWGNNDSGQIGDGTTNNRTTPHKLPITSKVATVTATGNGVTVYVIGVDGSLWAWGFNTWGETGNVTGGDNQLTPYRVQGLPKIAKIPAAFYAIDTNGNLWTWGGSWGNAIAAPHQIKALPKVSDFTTDGHTTWIIGVDGSLWAWGDNYSGQLGGDGVTASEDNPYKVKGLPKIAKITTDGYSTVDGDEFYNATVYAIGVDGSLWTWGGNQSGQVGDGTTTDRTTPYRLPITSKIANVTSVKYDGKRALGVDGSLWAWGGNWYRGTPTKVKGLPKITSVVDIYALGADGSLWAGTTKLQFKQ